VRWQQRTCSVPSKSNFGLACALPGLRSTWRAVSPIARNFRGTSFSGSGASVGFRVGCREGGIEGMRVGSGLGLRVGLGLGVSVGRLVGKGVVGAGLGWRVVGCAVGRAVGSVVWMGVNEVLRGASARSNWTHSTKIRMAFLQTHIFIIHAPRASQARGSYVFVCTGCGRWGRKWCSGREARIHSGRHRGASPRP
jgi:hypothetical protein